MDINAHMVDLEKFKYLYKQGYKCVKKSIKYEVLCESKNKLITFMQIKDNNYLKMEILKVMFPQFTEFEIMKILC